MRRQPSPSKKLKLSLMARRYDAGKVEKFTRTGSGGIRVDAALTRTGVFSYRREDGTERKEYRPEAEVFAPGTLETFAGLPVTVGHPGLVTAENWKQHAVGHVGESVRRDGDKAAATVFVNDAQAVAKVQAGELVEVSCGYDVDLEETPGEHNGERYDAIQRNIRGNHVALGPKGWGRAGPEVRLRMDGNQEDPATRDAAQHGGRDPSKDLRANGNKLEGMPTEETPIQAKNVEIHVDGAKEIEKLSAQNEMLTAKVEDLTKKLAASEDPKRLDSLVDERVALHTAALKVLPKADFSGKSPRDIKLAVIQATKPDFKADGKSDDYVSAAFDLALDFKATAPTAALGQLRADAVNAGPKGDPLAEAQKKMQERNANAWKAAK